MTNDNEATCTVAQLMAALQRLSDQHGPDTPVYVHDADTDWSLPLCDRFGVRFGLDLRGDGKENAIMIKSVGYHGSIGQEN